MQWEVERISFHRFRRKARLNVIIIRMVGTECSYRMACQATENEPRLITAA